LTRRESDVFDDERELIDKEIRLSEKKSNINNYGELLTQIEAELNKYKKESEDISNKVIEFTNVELVDAQRSLDNINVNMERTLQDKRREEWLLAQVLISPVSLYLSFILCN